MALRLIIPDFVPAADRRAVLERIRRDRCDAAAGLAEARARGFIPLDNIKTIKRRLRALDDLDAAWCAVQMDDVA